MRLKTPRSEILTVPERWHHQYPKPRGGTDEQMEIGRKLEALDLQKVTAGEIAKLIGNTSWVDMACQCCDQPAARALVQIENQYGEQKIEMCQRCVREALSLFPAPAKQRPSSQNQRRQTRRRRSAKASEV